MKEQIPVPSKTMQNDIDKGIIRVMSGNCEHVERKQFIYVIPVIVKGL
jgi:hypothetical protein